MRHPPTQDESQNTPYGNPQRFNRQGGRFKLYLAASPNQIDTIEYAYLEGQQGTYIETRNGFDVDGVEIKCRLDFGAKAIDWRGLYKNPGA